VSKLYVCTCCSKKKQPNEFYWNLTGKKKGTRSSNFCKDCRKDKLESSVKREKRLQYLRDYHKDNYEAIKERRAEYFKDYYIQTKEYQNKKNKEWREKNLDLHAAKEAKRRASKLNRTPSWLSESDISKIKSIYKMCRAVSKKTGLPHEVDHIIPLQGKLVSGLHVPWNLRIITSFENRSKHAKLIEDIV
jgi:hypothetical protein